MKFFLKKMNYEMFNINMNISIILIMSLIIVELPENPLRQVKACSVLDNHDLIGVPAYVVERRDIS